MNLKKLTHVFDYSGYATYYYNGTLNDNPAEISDVNRLRLRYQISNRLTLEGWTLVSMEPVFQNRAMTGFLVAVEKMLPAETVDKIVGIRAQADKVLHEILSEPLNSSAAGPIWRDTTYGSQSAAADARSAAAMRACREYTDNTDLSDLLAELPPAGY